uniref:Large ribosomal subunit protein uL23c n=1 Tax=Koshicola spirodelophila TaxID=1707787 RepID=A0A167MG96_9CHLO|nr:ribosomal protein L23 [Koshicola spirodelophila]
MIDLIKYPVLNYKTVRLLEQNKQYVFDVDIRLTKPIIKKLFEDYFGVEIIDINTHIKPRKKRLYISLSSGYKNRYKRVIIKLKKDQSIPYIEQLMAGYLNQIVSRANAQSTNQENNSN